MTSRTISIHLISPEASSPTDGWPLLCPEEQLRAKSFVFPKHAADWCVCRTALRQVLGNVIQIPPAEVPLITTHLGKPTLAHPFDNIHFNLSHCNDLMVIALCVDGPVGVDVESSGRATEMPGCEEGFCHPVEIESLPTDPELRGRHLLDLWTAKEAVLKALGIGFFHPPESVIVLDGTAASDIPLPGIEDQLIHRLDHPALARFSVAISAPRSATRIEIHSFETSTSAGSSAITAARPANPDG